MGPNRQPPDPEKAAEFALAEYSALRTEVDRIQAGQAALIGVALTFLGVIFGIVADGDDRERLLLVVPLVSMIFSLLWEARNYRMALMGNYVRVKLWPYLQKWDSDLPSWEREVKVRRDDPGSIWRAVFIDGYIPGLFFAASFVALVIAWQKANCWELVGGILATILVLGGPIAIGGQIKRMGDEEAPPGVRPPSASP